MNAVHRLIQEATNPNEFFYALKCLQIGLLDENKKLTIESFVKIFNDRDNHYHQFKILKKSGSTREISAPDDQIKNIQYLLKRYLDWLYIPHNHAHGFIKGKGIRSNAEVHVGKKYVLNIDIENFFPSISFHQIQKTLLEKPFNLPKISATTIAHFACYKSRLPQGGVISPVVSNLVCIHLDNKLSKLCNNYGFTYSRYVDDISISGDMNPLTTHLFFKNARKYLLNFGFKIKKDKTRLQSYSQRQSVTGLVVNQKVNVTQKELRALRAILFRVERDGWKSAQEHHESIGFSSDLKQYLAGKISFFKMVRTNSDPRVFQLHEDYTNLIDGKKRRKTLLKESSLASAERVQKLEAKIISTYQNKIELLKGSDSCLLIEAIKESNKTLLLFLLSHFENKNDVLNDSKLDLLNVAYNAKNIEMANYLIDLGAIPNNISTDIIYDLIRNGEIGNFKRILTHTIDLNQTNHNGETPLHLAIQFNQIELVKLLLEAGADRSIKDINGLTALDHAVSMELTDIKLLLNN